jgi:hypothetical protein
MSMRFGLSTTRQKFDNTYSTCHISFAVYAACFSGGKEYENHNFYIGFVWMYVYFRHLTRFFW